MQTHVIVSKVVVTNRADCCWEKFVNVQIRAGGHIGNKRKWNQVCGPKITGIFNAGETMTFKCHVPLYTSRYVFIGIEGIVGTLSFCEVQVYGYQGKFLFIFCIIVVLHSTCEVKMI